MALDDAAVGLGGERLDLEGVVGVGLAGVGLAFGPAVAGELDRALGDGEIAADGCHIVKVSYVHTLGIYDLVRGNLVLANVIDANYIVADTGRHF